jgi:hypothetical protein
MLRSFLILLAAAVLLRADFDPSHWELRRPLSVQPGAVARVRIDRVIYKGSKARLADLRVVRDGVETPYLLETQRGTSSETELHPSIVDKSVAPGRGLEFTLDLGVKTTHNQVGIATDQTNFKQRVRIETSEDGHHWSIARDDGYIFDFSQGDQKVSVLQVAYPSSTRRFVRVTIFGWSDPKFVESAALMHLERQPDKRETIARFDKPQRGEDAPTRSTLVTLDLGFSGLPHDQAQLDVTPGDLFYRAVEVESSQNGKDWYRVGSGVIERTADREDLVLDFPEQWDRYLRLRILNADDQPLRVSGISLLACERALRFPAKAAGTYWLYFGNAEARTPSYDLALVLPKQAVEDAPLASFGSAEPNPAYRAPVAPDKPWSDRHPGILYSVLGIAILGMGYLTMRLLAKVDAAGA